MMQDDGIGPVPPRRRQWAIISFCSVLTVLSGAGYNATFFEMGQKMPAYPMFLLYSATIVQTVAFAFAACWGVWTHRRQPSSGGKRRQSSAEHHVPGSGGRRSFCGDFFLWEQQGRMLSLGVCIIVNGLFSQFSDPYVNGDLQNVLNQMVLPIAGVLAWWFLKTRFTALNLLGTLIVLGGCLLVVLPPYLETGTATNRLANSPCFLKPSVCSYILLATLYFLSNPIECQEIQLSFGAYCSQDICTLLPPLSPRHAILAAALLAAALPPPPPTQAPLLRPHSRPTSSNR